MPRTEWLQNLVNRGNLAEQLKANEAFVGLMQYVDQFWLSSWLNAATVEERERFHARMTGLREILDDVLPGLIHEGEQASAELNGTPIADNDEEEIHAP